MAELVVAGLVLDCPAAKSHGWAAAMHGWETMMSSPHLELISTHNSGFSSGLQNKGQRAGQNSARSSRSRRYSGVQLAGIADLELSQKYGKNPIVCDKALHPSYLGRRWPVEVATAQKVWCWRR